MKLNNLKKVLFKNLKGLSNFVPILLSIILLISLINTVISKDIYSKIFTNYESLNLIIADFFGSILAGNAITSYLISDQLIQNNISLVIVTTFILSWTTVGIIQFPAESLLLGKRFAILRNSLAFIFAIIVSIISVSIYKVIL